MEGDSNTEQRQQQRFFKFVEMWKRVAAGNEVIVIGDFNIDYLKWNNPDFGLMTRLTEKVKNEIETLGFHQMTRSFTRCWTGVPVSLIDHCWTNVPGRMTFEKNLVRASSDHNLVIVSFRTRNKL